MPRNQGTSRKGKPKKGERAAGMGRALERSQQKRFRPKANGSSRGAGMAMAPGTTSIGVDDDDDDDAGAGTRMRSVLEMDDLTDFLDQAEMARREFASERERFVVLDSSGVEYKQEPRHEPRVQWSDRQSQKQAERQKRGDQFAFRELSVPRRPKWTEETTPAELDRIEKESFLEWRRGIAEREEELISHISPGSTTTVTPFEKNIEVWRQLWRVLERSSCVVQLVDGRNPLFYLSLDLRTYAEEELGKPMILLINKSDYLSSKQRRVWHEYLKGRGWEHLFFSAHEEQRKLDEMAATAKREERGMDERLVEKDEVSERQQQYGVDDDDVAKDEKEDIDEMPSENITPEDAENVGVESTLTRSELLDKLHDFAKRHQCKPDPRHDDKIQFGMVGFPNVGKSSVINVLVGSSKHAHGVVRVGVAAQPGKTKHFQTLMLPDRDDVMLCDCPGLVFPSFVSSTADLIAAGVYPISQMRDHWQVVELICRRIPREILNAHYGIHLPTPSFQDLKERGMVDPKYGRIGGFDAGSVVSDSTPHGMILPPPTAEELLATYCVARGMLAPSSGVPDYQRASRIIIGDYVNGKLLYCHPPPNIGESTSSPVGGKEGVGISEEEFHRETLLTAFNNTKKLREKFGKIVEHQRNQTGERIKNEVQDEANPRNEDVVNSENDVDLEEFGCLGVEDDIDILDVVGGIPDESTEGKRPAQGGKRGKAHKSIRKHGRKGRKDRNHDPYGCFSQPDDMLSGNVSGSGVHVNAGKYGSSGYTRANYAGARAAVPFQGGSPRKKV